MSAFVFRYRQAAIGKPCDKIKVEKSIDRGSLTETCQIENVIDGIIENEHMRRMTEDEKENGQEEIKKSIDNFDYNKLINQIMMMKS